MPRTRKYTVKRATRPIVIDGTLSEPDWKAAKAIKLVETVTGDAPNLATEARALWDDDYLYVAFHCVDTHIYSQYTQRDDPLWEQEVVEVFIDDNLNRITYLEYEFNPRNALVDLYVVNRNLDRDQIQFMAEWNSRSIRHAVTVDGDPASRESTDRSWTAEIAFPWDDFATAPHFPPHGGDKFRVNLYRIDRDRDGDEYSAWSPTGEINFHRPDKFGEFVFSSDPVR